MVSPKNDSTTTEYFTARSRTASLESAALPSVSGVSLAPLAGDGRRAISVSSNTKRQFKDRRIYVDKRSGLPVRPPTSFGLFKHALRRSIKGGNIDFFGFNREATEKWSKMSEEEKEPYAQRAKELADQYKKIEVRFLRRKLRQLQNQVKDFQRGASSSSPSSGGRRRRRQDA